MGRGNPVLSLSHVFTQTFSDDPVLTLGGGSLYGGRGGGFSPDSVLTTDSMYNGSGGVYLTGRSIIVAEHSVPPAF